MNGIGDYPEAATLSTWSTQRDQASRRRFLVFGIHACKSFWTGRLQGCIRYILHWTCENGGDTLRPVHRPIWLETPRKTIRQCQDKPWLVWALDVRYLREKYALFFAAVEEWLAHPRHYMANRDIGERLAGTEFFDDLDLKRDEDDSDEDSIHSFIVPDPPLEADSEQSMSEVDNTDHENHEDMSDKRVGVHDDDEQEVDEQCSQSAANSIEDDVQSRSSYSAQFNMYEGSSSDDRRSRTPSTSNFISNDDSSVDDEAPYVPPDVRVWKSDATPKRRSRSSGQESVGNSSHSPTRSNRSQDRLKRDTSILEYFPSQKRVANSKPKSAPRKRKRTPSQSSEVRSTASPSNPFDDDSTTPRHQTPRRRAKRARVDSSTSPSTSISSPANSDLDSKARRITSPRRRRLIKKRDLSPSISIRSSPALSEHGIKEMEDVKDEEVSLALDNISRSPSVVIYEDDEEYEIEKIIDSRTRGRSWQFLVRWTGYSPEHDTWLPASELAGCAALDVWLESGGDGPTTP